MSIPAEITVRGFDRTPAIEDRINTKIEKLSQYFDRIESVKVVAEIPQNHKHNGKLYGVKVDVLVPGETLVADKTNEDLYVAIRDTFDAMVKQVKKYSAKQRGDVKVHSDMLLGTVVRLYSDYGFIQGGDGFEYYFHETSLANGNFKDLNIGNNVNFIESAQTGESRQANHVSVVE